MKKRAFTLVEVLIAFSIFAVVMTLILATVTGLFRSLRQGEKMITRDQRQRLCLFRLSKEIASVTKLAPPAVSLSGDGSSFFLSLPKKTY